MSKTRSFSSNSPNSGNFSPTLSGKTKPGNMSQQNVMVYLDEVSMANGNNGESTIQVDVDIQHILRILSLLYFVLKTFIFQFVFGTVMYIVGHSEPTTICNTTTV